MVYLNEIVEFVNTVIKERLKAYSNSRYYGITYQAVKNEANTTIIYPSEIDINAKAGSVAINMKESFIVYHRLTGTSFTYPTSGNYGDGDTHSVSSATDLQVIVMGWRKKLNGTPEQLAMIIADSLPGSIKEADINKIGIKQISTQATGINYDPRTIFNAEYTGIPYFIGPEMFLFSIRYRITGSYLKGCLTNCEC